MTRVRLRPKHSDEALRQIYATPHDHTKWADHLLRVDTTTVLAQWMADQYGYMSAADLSCGDGAILRSLKGVPKKIYGDLAPGYDVTGPIEETVTQISPVQLFVCSETIEHLDDPDMVLRNIGQVAQALIVSTPISEVEGVDNDEHYWGWDVDDVGAMLENAGWDILVTNVIDFLGSSTYDYQIHACRRRP